VGVELMAVKVLNANGSGSYANIANGIIWAANNGAKVINLSLGGTFDSTTLRNAVDTDYPGAYTNCIAVGATDENDQKASFSNSGKKWVDIGAPGVHILSTMPNSPVTLTTSEGYYENYDSLNGTSMATPHVAGVAGLSGRRPTPPGPSSAAPMSASATGSRAGPTQSPDSPTTGPMAGASTP
jgi:thermitase